AYVRAGRGISLGCSALRDHISDRSRWNGAGLADVGGQIVAGGDDITARGASQDPQVVRCIRELRFGVSEVRVCGEPSVFDAINHRLRRDVLADIPTGTFCHRAARANVGMAINVGVADRESIDNAVITGYVAHVTLVSVGVVLAIGALGG